MREHDNIGPCLDELTALELVEHRLEPAGRVRWDVHLDRCSECRQLVAALAPDPEPPRYTLLRCVGRGGFGSVFAASDASLDRIVAIKLLDDADAAAEQLIRHEAQALARLSDPHVLAVYDVGRLDDQLFIATELMDGGSLRQWLSSAPEPAAVVDAFAQAAAGLHAAHRAGIVHGDFKAENVLRTTGGRVVVGDFGLARAVRQPTTGPDDDERSVLAGTPSHLAPELTQGARKSPATDQYAFGVALADALQGRGDRNAQRVAARASASEPSRRFESMAALRRALEAKRARTTGPIKAWLAGGLAAIGFVALAHRTGPTPTPPPVTDASRELRCDDVGMGYDEAVDPRWEEELERAHDDLQYEGKLDTVQRLESLAAQAAERGWPCAQGRAQILVGAAWSVRHDPVSAAENFAAAALIGESLDHDLMVVRGWSRAVRQSVIAGELESAREQLRHAVAYGERHDWAPDLAAAIDLAQAAIASAEGRYEATIEHLERGLDGGLVSTDRAQAHANMASALVRLNRVDEAAEHATAALELYDELVPGAHSRIGVLDLLTRIATQRGQHDEAVQHATALLDALASAGQRESLNYGVALNVRGVALTQRGDYDPARADLDRARRRYETLLGPDTPTTGNAWYALGQLERLADNPRVALAHLDRALPLAEASGNPHFAGNVLLERCQVLRELDDVDATPTCSRAYEQLSSILEADDPNVIAARELRDSGS